MTTVLDLQNKFLKELNELGKLKTIEVKGRLLIDGSVDWLSMIECLDFYTKLLKVGNRSLRAGRYDKCGTPYGIDAIEVLTDNEVTKLNKEMERILST